MMTSDRLILDIKLRILSLFVRPSQKRREKRGRDCVEYLRRYLPPVGSIKSSEGKQDGEEKFYSIWLQGEDAAPEIVKACWRSARRNLGRELVILDEKAALSIGLPDYVVRKYKAGKMKPAHFADICRVELLHKFGGYWLDSTCFVTSDIPDHISDAGFFMFMADTHPNFGYSFVQNCFIRSGKGEYLLEAWRAMILEFWRNENRPVDYFVHQLLFRTLVENDPQAMECFRQMPKVSQDVTHALWWGYADLPYDDNLYKAITGNSFFQKTTYRHRAASSPIPGSFADVMLKMY